MKQYAVLHLDKHSSTGGGLGNHIDRVPGKEHTYPHADPARRNLNLNLENPKFKGMNMYQAISKRIENGYTGKTAIRKDAVRFLSLILSGSHDRMKEIEKTPELFKEWISENANFIKEEFGIENLIRFSVHRDEKTPHIHAVIVPLTKDGRLSAKEIVGDKKKLKEFQNRYGQKMSRFKLERGELESKNTHITTAEFYKTVEKTRNEVENLPLDQIKYLSPAEKHRIMENAVKKQILDFNLKDLNLKKSLGRKL